MEPISAGQQARPSETLTCRACDVLEEFRRRVDERGGGADVPATLRERIRELSGELREARKARHEEIADLRRTVDILAQQVQALALDNRALREQLDQYGKVVALPPAAGRRH
ncbi:hypothetical protein ACIHAA_24075 [Streptomyces sp. NPDC052040]|uniref:hypothetical protein n=1 Tax=unclassified Streptomyces TaxID=2593676 RepID=UPI0037D44B80